MKTVVISIIAIAIVVGVTVGGKLLLEKYAPEAEKKSFVERVLVVETSTVMSEDFEVPLTSEGVVETRRDTILSAQVAGRLVNVDSTFEIGARFKAGHIIAEIDPVDYESALAQSESVLAEAKLALIQEEARAEQSARDWAKIGGGKPASDLVLRVPFVKSAEARVAAAIAGLKKAAEDLERTKIRAPYDCRVRAVNLNKGAMVAPGSQLGTIFDPEQLLIRLPFSLDDYAQISKAPEIRLYTVINGKRYEWKSELLWDLGEVDQQTLSAYVLAQVVANESGEAKFRLPPPGVFLKADLKGMVMPGVVKVPRSAVRGRNEVFVLSKEKTLAIRELTIVRSNAEAVFVTDGITGGEKVILTKIELPVEGMKLEETKKEELPLN